MNPLTAKIVFLDETEIRTSNRHQKMPFVKNYEAMKFMGFNCRLIK